jgi:hypothetical protein
MGEEVIQLKEQLINIHKHVYQNVLASDANLDAKGDASFTALIWLLA